MQKKLIALAIAGLASSAAFAQSNVTIYGVLDVGVGHSSETFNFDPYHPVGVNPGATKGATSGATGMFNGGLSASRLGLKGSEDLGDGLKAIFTAETGFDLQSGNLSNAATGLAMNKSAGPGFSADSSMSGQLFGRQAWVGLESKDWGKVTLGRNVSFGLDSVIVYDPMEGSQVFSPIGYSGSYMGGGYTDDARLDSSIKYTNTYDNWNYGAMYKFGGMAGASTAGTAYQFSGGYKADAWGIQATYMKHKDALSLSNGLTSLLIGGTTYNFAGVTAAAADTTAWVLAGNYQFDNKLKFSLGYEHMNFTNPSDPTQDCALTSAFGYTITTPFSATCNVNTTAFAAGDKTLNTWWAGLKYPFTSALSGTIAYYHVAQPSFGTGAGSSADGTNKYTSLLLDYRLSKRTDLYGGYMHDVVDGGLASGWTNSPSSNFYGAGMRHSF